MKRCPECDFIYEEEQHLCDMDGMALVHDSCILPESSKAIVPPPTRPVGRQLMLVVSVVVLTGFGLYLANYSASVEESHPVSSLVANASDSAALSAPRAAPFSSRSIEDSADGSETTSDERLSERRESTGTAKALPWRSISPGSQAAARTSRPQLAGRRVKMVYSPDEKRESRIGSFLKKTGRFFKRPFKR
jgi:hypothetical protein